MSYRPIHNHHATEECYYHSCPACGWGDHAPADFAGFKTWLAARERAAGERALRDYVVSIPEPDNHHNAGICPYCSPQRAEDAEKARADERERIALAIEAERESVEAGSNWPDGCRAGLAEAARIARSQP